jgi:hypothetical protein
VMTRSLKSTRSNKHFAARVLSGLQQTEVVLNNSVKMSGLTVAQSYETVAA